MSADVRSLKLKRTTLSNGRVQLTGITRGMILWVRLTSAETVGGEQHSDKPRPWLVVSTNHMHAHRGVFQATPLTKQAHQRHAFPAARVVIRKEQILPNPHTRQMRSVDSVALVDLTRAVAHDRVVGDESLGRVVDVAMYDVDAALSFVFNIEN